MNMDKYFMWIHYERLHNHNKAKHNKTMCIFLGIYCSLNQMLAILQRLDRFVIDLNSVEKALYIEMFAFAWDIDS